MLNRTLVLVLLAAFCILASATHAAAATDVWIAHVALRGGWKTAVSVYYAGTAPSASFTLARADESGNPVDAPLDFSARTNTWASIPETALAYNGTAHLQSKSNLLVKVTYRYGQSSSVCEFYLDDRLGQEWVLPNAGFPWFDWAGIALMNSNAAPVTVVLEAWNEGTELASRSATLAARSQYVNTSDMIWDGVSAAHFDTAVVRASLPITAPISITGNYAQDRHVFFTAQPRPQNERSIYLANGTLIDGTGGEPVSDAAVVIRNGRIFAAGRRADVAVPDSADILDAGGGFILPGFINAHVHNAFREANLRTWARAGVTTVRDVGAAEPPAAAFAFRDSVKSDLSCARVVAAGPLVTVPGGYPISVNFPGVAVTSPEDARVQIGGLLDQGAELIKITIEDGLGQGIPTAGWPTLTPAEVRAIAETAHSRGIPVTAHITFRKYLQVALDAGVDDCAHSIFDPLPDSMIRQMLSSRMALVPTLMAQGKNGYSMENLLRFLDAGGKVAMGNDGGYVAGMEIGMPITELEAMRDAGMTPMQVIVAATRNAAEVCRLEKTLGTIEFDKQADILVVRGNPLENLRALLDVEHVIHAGTVIR